MANDPPRSATAGTGISEAIWGLGELLAGSLERQGPLGSSWTSTTPPTNPRPVLGSGRWVRQLIIREILFKNVKLPIARSCWRSCKEPQMPFLTDQHRHSSVASKRVNTRAHQDHLNTGRGRIQPPREGCHRAFPEAERTRIACRQPERIFRRGLMRTRACVSGECRPRLKRASAGMPWNLSGKTVSKSRMGGVHAVKFRHAGRTSEPMHATLHGARKRWTVYSMDANVPGGKPRRTPTSVLGGVFRHGLRKSLIRLCACVSWNASEGAYQ